MWRGSAQRESCPRQAALLQAQAKCHTNAALPHSSTRQVLPSQVLPLAPLHIQVLGWDSSGATPRKDVPTEVSKALLPAYRGHPLLLPSWDQAEVLKLQVLIQGLGCSVQVQNATTGCANVAANWTACRQRLRRLRFHLQQCHKPLIQVGILISSQGCLQMSCGLQGFFWLLCSCTQHSSCQPKLVGWVKAQKDLPQTRPLSPALVPP